VHIHLSYRDGDATGFALSLRRELARLAPDVKVTWGAIDASGRQPTLSPGATLLILVGTRWMRPELNAALYFADASDPMRRLLEAVIENSLKIVPVLFQVPLASWGTICGALPASISPLANLNAFEIRSQSFASDLDRLLTWLRSPDQGVVWTEAGMRTLIRVEAEGGGALKWWSNRNTALHLLVDDAEVGALTGWDGQFDATVKPGRHSVQVREGLLSKSKVVVVEVALGATVTLVCGRNIFTGAVSLNNKG
jgi:hypothetical protein